MTFLVFIYFFPFLFVYNEKIYILSLSPKWKKIDF